MRLCNTLVGGGLALGVIASVVLLKRRMWPVYTLGGIGLGMGVANCNHDLRAPYALHGKKLPASEVRL